MRLHTTLSHDGDGVELGVIILDWAARKFTMHGLSGSQDHHNNIDVAQARTLLSSVEGEADREAMLLLLYETAQVSVWDVGGGFEKLDEIESDEDDEDDASPAASPPPLLDVSPETSGIWKCTRCTNLVHFIAIDDRGWGGPDACDGSCGFDEERRDAGEEGVMQFCECETVLTQDITVKEPNADGTVDPEADGLDYACFTGGESDAEIGEYTRIYCGACDALLWLDPTLDEATRTRILTEEVRP